MLAEALAAIDEGVVVQSLDGAVLACNPRAGELIGTDSADVVGRAARELPLRVLSEHRAPIPTDAALGGQVLESGQPLRRVLVQFGRADGTYVWVLASQRPLADAQCAVWGAAASFVEITEQWEATRQFAYLATHDVLTRLPNRWAFEDQLEPALARGARSGAGVLVLFMDLDAFKPVNDELGHAAGDELLRRVADRLRAVVRGGDLLCRYGGDEFAALVPDLPMDEAGRTAERLMKRIGLALAEPIDIAGGSRHITISVGSAVFPLDAPDATGLLLHADSEMYRRKRLRHVV